MKAAFPSISVNRLLHNLRDRGVPKEYVDWIKMKMQGRKMTLNFNDYTSEPFEIENGCDQGDPLSVVMYNSYNAGLLEVVKPKEDKLAIGYIDNVNLLKVAKTFVATNDGLKDMMLRPGGAEEWSKIHSSSFKMDKLQLIGFSRKRKKYLFLLQKTMPIPRHALRINGHIIKPAETHKYLGVILNKELCFKNHAAYVIRKGMGTALQVRQLVKTKTKRGVAGKYIRRLYKTVVIPQMLYATNIWFESVWKKEG